MRDGSLRAAQLAAVALILASISLVTGVALGLYVYMDAKNRSDERTATLKQAVLQNCYLHNSGRREVNKQARAFIHHNTATLRYFQRVYPLLQGPEARKFRTYTRAVIGAYKAVQTRYHTLPLVDCEKFVERPFQATEGRPVPIKPGGGDRGGGDNGPGG